MAVTKQQKVEILNELIAKFKEAKSIGFATTSTMTVAEFAELRTDLRLVSASYTLAKKTLIRKALKEALNIEIDLSNFEGQIGAVCSNDDAMAGLGKVNDLVKKPKFEKISWAACIFDWELKTLEETKVLAGMPSKETLLSRLVGSMKSPISGLARFFDAAAKDLESQGKAKVSELKGEKTVAPVTEVKVETPTVEEVKTEEVVAETSTVEETPTEEAKV